MSEKFDRLLREDLQVIGEKIAPVLGSFPDHFPTSGQVLKEIEQNGRFPEKVKVKERELAQRILEKFSEVVGDTREAIQEFAGVRVIYKYESENPSGSHYDRAYAPIFEKHLSKILAGKTLFELSSGSAGISAALYTWLLGADLKLFMPETKMRLRTALPAALGANVVLTPEVEGVEGASRAFNLEIPRNRRDLIRSGLWPLNHSQTDTTLPAIAALVDEIDEKLDHAVFVYGNGTFMRGVGEKLGNETAVWGVRYTHEEPEKRLIMPGNDEVDIGFRHHDKYQPDELVRVSLNEVEYWRNSDKRKRPYGLTTSAVRVATMSLIESGKIKPGESVLIPDYEPGARCEVFD